MPTVIESPTKLVAVCAYFLRENGFLAGGQRSGTLRITSENRLELQLTGIAFCGHPAFLVGVTNDDHSTSYLGLQCVRNSTFAEGLTFPVVRGGVGERILAEEGRMPIIDAVGFRYERAFSADVYAQWEEAGILRRVILDRALVCPKCSALPTFRFACPRCQSARQRQTVLVHHFACANVDPIEQYTGETSLQCPKCRTQHLIAGTDFEYAPGEHHCLDCHWKSRELTQVGHCLQCDLRFPLHQAVEQELEGYDVNRVDALDFIPFVE